MNNLEINNLAEDLHQEIANFNNAIDTINDNIRNFYDNIKTSERQLNNINIRRSLMIKLLENIDDYRIIDNFNNSNQDNTDMTEEEYHRVHFQYLADQAFDEQQE